MAESATIDDVTTYQDESPPIDIDSETYRSAVHSALLGWWDGARRDLPWRRTSDPYAVLISEAMLQQTGVARVIPKYLAFMQQFPSLAALAAAPGAAVIRAWAGMGYNRRAVNLHRLAREVAERHGGRLPPAVDALLALPGIGPYTARAVASIAFGQPAAAVDTNVRRVLSRLVDGVDSDRRPPAIQRLADDLLAVDRPGDWNQALMDLGAGVCTAAAPRCNECPLRHLCAAAPRIRAVAESGGRYRATPVTKPQGRYAHSARFYRGRIVDLLRVHEGADALTAPLIGARLRLDYSVDDLPWLRALLHGLARDGLLDWQGVDDDPVRLPT